MGRWTFFFDQRLSESDGVITMPIVKPHDKNTFFMVGDGDHWDLIVTKQWFLADQLKHTEVAGKDFSVKAPCVVSQCTVGQMT